MLIPCEIGRSYLRSGVFSLLISLALLAEDHERDLRQAEALVQQGNYKETMEICRGLLQSTGAPPRARYLLSLALFRQEDYAGAAREVEEYLRIEPESAAGLALLGTLRSKEERFAEAEKTLTASLHADPKQAPAWKQLGWVFYKTGQYAEAGKALEKSLALNPPDPEIPFVFGLLKYAAHDHAGAAEMAQRALALRPDHLESCLLLAQCLVDLQQYENAEWVFGKALKISQGSPQPSEKPYERYGLLLIVLSRLDEAQRMFTQALTINPKSVPALLGRANVRRKQDQSEAALADAELATRLDPESEAAHSLLLRAYLALGLTGKARAHAEWLEARNKSRLSGPPGKR